MSDDDFPVLISRSLNPRNELRYLEPIIAAEYEELYGDADEAGEVNPDWFRSPMGGLLVAFDGPMIIGCAGWTFLSTLGYDNLPEHWNPRTYAEVKRMWVSPDWRGNGLSKLLDQVRAEDAKLNGVEVLVGETGEEQQISAKAHLSAMGYDRVEPFGKWAENPGSTFFGKRL